MQDRQRLLEQISTLQEAKNELKAEVKEVQLALEAETKERLRIQRNHNALTKRRQYHQMKRGRCIYGWHCPATPEQMKIGMSDDINECLAAERRCVPYLHLDFLIYLTENRFVETAILLRYQEYLVEPNHEIVGVASESVLKSVRAILKWAKLDFTEEEELWKYNNEYPPATEEIEDEEPEEKAPSVVTYVTNITINTASGTAAVPTKKCTQCHLARALSDFTPRYDRGPGATQSWCRHCRAKIMAEKRARQQVP